MDENKEQAPDRTVTFGDSSVEFSGYDRFKGEKGQTYRLAVISQNLMQAHTHFVQTPKKTLFRCLSQRGETPAVCCKTLGEPDQRFGMVLWQYRTEMDGALTDEKKLQGVMKVWVVSENRYRELSAIHKDWPLLDGGYDKPQHDLKGFCSESEFQRFQWNPCPNAHWKKKKEWYEAVAGKANSAKKALVRAMGRVVSEDEVKEMLGVAVTSPTGAKLPAEDELDLSDIMDQ